MVKLSTIGKNQVRDVGMKDAIGIIKYRTLDGKDREWVISAHPTKDNEETLAQHFEKYLGDTCAILISCRVVILEKNGVTI